MLGPVRRFIPVLTGDDIKTAVAIDIGYDGGFAGAEVDGVLFKGDLSGAGELIGEQEGPG